MLTNLIFVFFFFKEFKKYFLFWNRFNFENIFSKKIKESFTFNKVEFLNLILFNNCFLNFVLIKLLKRLNPSVIFSIFVFDIFSFSSVFTLLFSSFWIVLLLISFGSFSSLLILLLSDFLSSILFLFILSISISFNSPFSFEILLLFELDSFSFSSSLSFIPSVSIFFWIVLFSFISWFFSSSFSSVLFSLFISKFFSLLSIRLSLCLLS